MKLKTIADAKDWINSNKMFDIEKSFELSRFCLSLLKDKSKEHLGREITIRVLDNKDKFPEETKSLWNDIVEVSGLYPYVDPETLW